jgi:predicted dehydrogenase/threonine dehydrogenase-like Zn-dependent dehydrogenase
MKQIAQNYRSGDLTMLEVPAPACRPGGVVVRSAFSLISAGTELMKVSESKLSLLGKARARPDQVRKVLTSVRQQGLAATFKKVMNRLDSYTPLGYSLAGTVVEVGAGVEGFVVGQAVACAGNQYAFHADCNWVPVNLCVPVPDGVGLDQAAFTTVAAIALQGMRQSGIMLGESACVVGLGLLGQILVRLLRGAGVTVVGTDLVADRCRAAEAAGASLCARPGAEEFKAFRAGVAELTGGMGVDCVFITAGGSDAGPAELAADLARDRGRVVDIGKCRLDLPWNAYYEKELDVRFSRSYGPGRYDPLYEEGGIDYPIGYVRWTERRNMECVLELLASGRLDFAPLITETVPFEAAVDTYERMNAGTLTGIGVLFRYPDAPAPLERRLAAPRGPATTRSGRVRIGVIGAGNYASSMLLPHLAADPDVALTEVVTNTALSGANAVRKFGFARSSTDVDGLLAAEDVDAVLIATRHSSHARLVRAALRAGKAVYVEKPLAIDRGELAAIVDSVAETGNDRLMVGFNRRFSPLMVRMKEAWGKRVGAHMLHYRINAGALDRGSWYANAGQEGSRFVGEGGHFIDLAAWWLGSDPVAVQAAAAGDDPDNLSLTVGFADGSVATIAYLTDGDPRFPKERIDIFGQGQTAFFDNFRRFEIWSGGRGRTVRGRGLDKGQRAELKAFVQAVKTGGPMPIPVETLVAVTAATLAAADSLAAGRSVPVAALLAPAG